VTPYTLTLLGAGCLIVLVAWLPRWLAQLPLSLPIVCIVVGWAVFSLPWVNVEINPLTSPKVTEHLAELVVLVSLMGAGLKLDRPFGFLRWRLTWRMLALAMPLTILAVTGLGVWGLGLSFATALLLAGAIAPTDPVLASDVQVGPPGSGEEDEVRFTLTSEAGLNDGLAFPFVHLALALSASAVGASVWPVVGEWALDAVLWKLAAGVAAGWLIGTVAGWLTFRVPDKAKLSATGDGFVALGLTLASYAIAELIHGYGFIAVFIMAMTLRAAHREHDFHETLHDSAEQTERLLMMVVLVLLGGAIADGLLASLHWSDVAVALAIIFLVRPAASMLSLLGSERPWNERLLISFFGIRGIGTIYYLAYALNHGQFEQPARLWAICGLVVLGSVFIHGITSTPAMSVLDKSRRRRKADEDEGPQEEEAGNLRKTGS
jgi:NhaP-type Na+/H+ or K+/H+ antiporter